MRQTTPQRTATAIPPRRRLPNIRRLHGTFTAIYTIVAAFLLGAQIFFINYEVVFQVGLLSFWIGTAFLMLSCVIIGKELLRAAGCVNLFTIAYAHTISIIFCCVACIIFSFFYLWNLIQILSMCDDFQSHHNMSHMMQTQIDVLVSYKAPFHSIIRQQALLLKYTMKPEQQEDGPTDALPMAPGPPSTRHVEPRILRQKPQHPYSVNQTFLRHLLREQPQQQQDTSYIDEEVAMGFSLLDHEVDNLIRQESQRIEAKNSFPVRTDRPIYTTTHHEDLMFQELRARKICRNEQGFAIFWIIFIILTDLMNLITIGVYCWLRTFYRC
jgi:hypothetical protein